MYNAVMHLNSRIVSKGPNHRDDMKGKAGRGKRKKGKRGVKWGDPYTDTAVSWKNNNKPKKMCIKNMSKPCLQKY